MTKKTLVAPIADRVQHTTSIHGSTIVDYYHWLRDQNWPYVQDSKILAYLEAENQYYNDYSSQYEELIEQIFQEMKGRVKEDDYHVPYKDGEYYYYSYIKPGQQYWIYARKYLSLNNIEEVLLDGNVLASSKEYMHIGNFVVSPDHKLLLYTVDFYGGERYTIYVKEIATGEIIDVVNNVMGGVEWDAKSTGFFYTPVDKNWRTKSAYYHMLGIDPANDVLLYEEIDETFSVSLRKSNSRAYVFINTNSSDSNELYIVESDFDIINGKVKLVEGRRSDHIYDVEHHKNDLYVLTNDVHPNFRVVRTEVTNPEAVNWQEVVAPSGTSYLTSIHVYKYNLVLSKKELGLPKIHIFSLTDELCLRDDGEIIFSEPAYEAYVVYTTFDAQSLRYAYSSLKTPKSIIEKSFSTGQSNILKVDEIPSGHSSKEYTVERLWVDAGGGIQIPISILYKNTLFKKDGMNLLYLHGYGSYGVSVPPAFHNSIYSLVDRGFIYAIAHIRGGDDLGRQWYHDARFLSKKHTFEDFIAVAEHLINESYTAPGRITICGASAGGMLIGAVINMRPELFRTAIAVVPFVDVLNTMLDDTLPLTAQEFKEWGDPKQQHYYEYIKSYSPYDNVKKQEYPNILVISGLSDPRVSYWEPTKWVALLRHEKIDNNVVLLKTNMKAGHGGLSGRFNLLQEYAEVYAFVIHTSLQ